MTHTSVTDPALSKWWDNYKENFITPEGRVRRPRDNDDTVSEGQAYAMLAAVFVNDQATFDKLFKWTDEHLSRRQEPSGDHLLAWHWQSGEVVDQMPASDADCDFALALILATKQWGEKRYLTYGKQVMSSIMAKEVIVGPGNHRLLLPGLWGHEEDGSIVQNPSYYNPAAFRLYYHQTDDPRWLELVETSYWVWQRSGESLGDMKGNGLQPDWCLVRSDGTFALACRQSYDYGWESVRMPMRLGLDYIGASDPRALQLLQNGISKRLAPRQLPSAVHKYNGQRAVAYESLASTAMIVFSQDIMDGRRNVFEKAFLDALFSPSNRDEYYGQSLSVFPLSLHADRLAFLFQTVAASDP